MVELQLTFLIRHVKYVFLKTGYRDLVLKILQQNVSIPWSRLHVKFYKKNPIGYIYFAFSDPGNWWLKLTDHNLFMNVI